MKAQIESFKTNFLLQCRQLIEATQEANEEIESTKKNEISHKDSNIADLQKQIQTIKDQTSEIQKNTEEIIQAAQLETKKAENEEELYKKRISGLRSVLMTFPMSNQNNTSFLDASHEVLPDF